MPFYNSTGVIGMAIDGLTTDVTGSLTLTLGLIMIFILLIMVLLRLPFEIGIIFCMPIVLVMMAYNSSMIPIGVLVLIIGGFIVARGLFGR
jgi:hypothetical protein